MTAAPKSTTPPPDSAEFEPSGIVTLTTDFGHKGPYVATMKGVLWTRHPQAKIVDVSHEVAVHWPVEAGFWLARSFTYFPAGTVHVAVVDPGVGTERDILILAREGQLFMAPDNGLLASLLPDANEAAQPGVQIRRVSDACLAKLGIVAVSATFHGRDIFAPIAAELAAGKLTFAEVGPVVESADMVPSLSDEVCQRGPELEGVVVTADHFGNVITNIDGERLHGFRTPVVAIAGREVAIHRTYGNVVPGELLALINSFGVVEIARAEGSAESLLGVARGAKIRIRESP